MAFQALYAAVVDPEGEKPVLRRKLLCRILESDVSLPDWAFEIDPCRWEKKGDRLAKSPLADKIKSIREYDAKVSEKQERHDARRHGSDTKDVPEDPDCVCDEKDYPCLPPDPCCAEVNYYVTDLLVMKDENHCYKASDLAYVENVAAGETRVRKHSFVRAVEDYSEEEETTSRMEERDHQVTERSRVQKEVQKEIAASLDVEARYGSDKNYVLANAGLDASVSKSEAREKFREAVERATLSIQTETRKLRTQRVSTESSEHNKHKFENAGDVPLVTKYFWVTQVKRGQVFNHGPRLTVDLLIPSPAALYERLEEIRSGRAINLQPPDKPTIKASQIEPESIGQIAQDAGLEEYPSPPISKQYQHFSLYESPKQDSDVWTDTPIEVVVPPDHVITEIDIGDAHTHPTDDDEFFNASLFVGASNVYQTSSGERTTLNFSKNLNLSGAQSLNFFRWNIDSHRWRVKLTYEPSLEAIAEWQKAVWTLVQEKYQEDLRAYESALAELQRSNNQRIEGRHPFAAEEIMKAEIKRAAIYMMCEDFERDDVMNMKSEPCGYPEINRSQASERTPEWYFWDRAFDWNLFSYKFYDYFWNPICTWPDKFDPGDQNYMMNAFLRAGYARVQIPAAEGMSEDVVWYLQTRDKWGPSGTIPLNAYDPRWVSVVQEIRHAHDCYQTDREGEISAILDTAAIPPTTTNQLLLSGTDRYWDATSGSPGVVDQTAIDLDIDHEIYVDGIAYRIVNIELDPDSPPYSSTAVSEMQWIITLERTYEGEASDQMTFKHAVGAEYVGGAFLYELPTELIWAGDHENNCLPCYPLPDCE